MNRSYLYILLKERKVIICVIFGLLFLLLALAITYNYFGIRDFDKSKLIHFSENLANGLQEGESMEQWLFAQKDSIELWINNEIEAQKMNVIQKVVKYLETHVPWWKVWLTIISFIATCLFIFEFFRNKIAQIVGEERAPFSWKLDTGIISKFRKLDSFQPIVEYFTQPLHDWASGKVKEAKVKISKFAEDEMTNIVEDFQGFIEDDLTKVGLRGTELGNIFSKKINSELSKGSLLILIDRISSHDHFAQFWKVAADSFVSKGIPANSYFFNGDPRVCFNDSQKQGISLAGLTELHPDSILVVIGDGSMLIKPDECQLNAWTQVLLNWQTRFLLSPRNFYVWGRRENLLKELFHLFPAKFSSLQYLTPNPNDEGSIDFPIDRHVLEHGIDYEQVNFNESNLHKYFGNSFIPKNGTSEDKEKETASGPILDWISSCAFHQDLDFQLSLELGYAQFDRFEGAKITPEIILSVFQLPWFRTGKIEEKVRVAIAKQFEEKSTGVVEEIRKFLKMKWPKWQPPKDSYAGDTFSEAGHINEWKITDPAPDAVTKRKIKNELNKIYDRGVEPDRILEVTTGMHNRYSKYFQPWVRPLIFNHGYSGLGLTQRLKNIFYSLLAGLLLLLIYCIVIWLSRPMMGDDRCRDCPSSRNYCAPVTQLIGATDQEGKKVLLTGTEDRPQLAYLTGYNLDCCLPLQIQGSKVRLMIEEETIAWLPGEDRPALRQLGQSEILRMEISDRLEVTITDSIYLTVFVPVFDTVQVKIINQQNDSRIIDQGGEYIVKFSEPDRICANLLTTFRERSIIRTDTVNSDVDHDTTMIEVVVNSPEPDTMLSEFYEKRIRLIYDHGKMIIRDTIRISDGTSLQKIQLEPCPECPENPCDSLIVNIACTGNDLDKFMTRPILRLNGEIIVSERDFANPVRIPFESITQPKLEFKLDPPHQFRSGQSVLIRQFTANNTQIDLDVYDPTDMDTILQIKGDIIILDANTNYTTKVNFADSDLRLYHCWEGVIRETIEHQNGYFCYNLKDYSFCGSRIQIEYKGSIHGSKLISEYKVLTRCDNNLRCADFGTIGIKSDTGRSRNLSPCDERNIR